MELNEALYGRRAVRSYEDTPVETSLLMEIAKAGTYAATGMGKQSPKIVIVNKPELVKKLSVMNREVMGQTEGDPFYGAPSVIVVLADANIGTRVYDGSLVMGNMMLKAHELGLASCWIHRAKEVFASEEGKKILAEAGVTGELEGIGNLIVGYRKGDAPAARPRKDDYITVIE